jgi:integrase
LATIINRDGKYLVRVRKANFKPENRTFDTRTEAKQWALQTEAAMANGSWISDRKARITNLDSLFRRYIAEIHGVKPFGKSKLATVRSTARRVGHVRLSDLSPAFVLSYAKQRASKISPSTLNQELTYFAQAIDVARTLWNAPIKDNHVRSAMGVMSQLDMIQGSRKRNRRPTDHELQTLIHLAKNSWIAPIIKIAVETGLRQSEIHAIEWSDIDFTRGTLLIRNRKDPKQKAGNDQLIPLLPVSREALLREKQQSKQSGRVFEDVLLAASISDKFAKLTKKANIKDLRFHDLRHEAISRMFEKGMAIPEVAAISGHKQWTSLKRYTQLSPKALSTAFAKQPPSEQRPQS